ncbi:MAG: WD40 repeat domain-containing protein [Okeania sp. SIO3C4]|nr:WD40 repeat domain-containing protein [Okeania sp. SIO3C4]
MIPEKERGYVEKSRKRRERERQKLISGLTGGLLMVSLLAVGAVWQWRRAVVGEKNAVMKANIATLETRFASEQLDALVEGIKIGKELKDADWATIENRIQGANMLRKMVDVEGWKEFSLLEGSDFEFSPDGSIIASITNNEFSYYESGIVNTIKLWKTDGSLVANLVGHDAKVNHVAFSPDGNLIASASNDTTVKLWKPDGTLVATLVGHEEEVNDVVFSPDGKLIASGSNDTTVKLWKPDGTLVATLVGHEARVNDVVFSPDSNLIASASDDGTVKLWKPDGILVATLEGHKDDIHTVVFSPNGQLIASGSDFYKINIIIWKSDGSLVTEMQKYGEVFGLKFSPDGKFVVSGDSEGRINFWKLDGTRAFSLEGHIMVDYSFAFTPDGNLIASGGDDNIVRVLKADGTLVSTLAHPLVEKVAFSPDGSTLAAGGGNNTIKLWKKKVSAPIKAEDNLMTKISPNANLIATDIHNNSVKLWETNGSLVINLPWDREAIVSPNGKFIASINKQTLKINKLDGTLVATLKHHQDSIENVAFSPDSQLIASVNKQTIKVSRLDGTLVTTLKHQHHQDFIRSVIFSPNSQLIALIGDEIIKIWKLDGTLVAAFKHDRRLKPGVVFSPDSKLVAFAAEYENIKVWKLDGTLVATFRDYAGIAFSPDSKLIAISSIDAKVKLYKTDGSLAGTFTSYPLNTFSASAFSPNGQLIVNSGLGGIKIHKLDGTLITSIESPNAFPSFVSFSPEGYPIAIVHDYDTASQNINSNVRLWNLDLNTLLKQACDWVGDYLSNSPNVSEEDKRLCNDIK